MDPVQGRTGSGQYWQGWTVDEPTGVVILVHGVHEHGGRYEGVAERLADAGYASYTVDHPGHGRSPGRCGDIGSMEATVAGAVISAPALDTSASHALQRVLSRLVPGLGVLALDADAVSRDPEVVAAYRADPLNHMGKIVAWLDARLPASWAHRGPEPHGTRWIHVEASEPEGVCGREGPDVIRSHVRRRCGC